MDRRALGALVRRLSAEVEAIRGLRFQREVPFRVLSPATIAAHFAGDGDPGAVERADEQLVVALGHLRDERSMDHDALARMMGAEAQGFYDPSDGILTISEVEARGLGRPGPAGLEARATVVHELVHALQHQHFRGRVETPEDAPSLSDRAAVRLALLEGDATLVTLEWQARQRGGRMLGTPDQARRVARWADNALVLTEVNVPPYFIDAVELPYAAGLSAVSAMHTRGGWDAVNEALTRESLRTGELLHPERAEGALGSVPEPEPVVHARRVLSRELGELELRLLLSSVIRKERAALLAGTWRGDRVALDVDVSDGTMILRWNIACATVEDARGLTVVLQPLLDRWRREGCPRMRGSSAASCRTSVSAWDEQGRGILQIQRGTRFVVRPPAPPDPPLGRGQPKRRDASPFGPRRTSIRD